MITSRLGTSGHFIIIIPISYYVKNVKMTIVRLGRIGDILEKNLEKLKLK